MKIKPIKNDISLYDTARFNENVKGNHVLVRRGEISSDKKEYANISLFSLMSICGFYEPKKGKSNEEIINQMIINASNMEFHMKEL